MTEFSTINCKMEELDTLLKRFGKDEAPTTGTRAADQSMQARTEENVTTVDELVGLLSHAGRPEHIVQHARYQKRRSNTVQHRTIIHRDLGLKCLRLPTPLLLLFF